MALGSTQPLTEMSIRKFPGSNGGRCIGLTTLPPSCADCRASTSWNPQGLSRPVMELLYLFLPAGSDWFTSCPHHLTPAERVSSWLSTGWWVSDTNRKVSAPSGMGSSQATQPIAQSLLRTLPCPSEPFLIYKIQESDNSMQIVDIKPACVETANSSIYSCNHPKDHEGVRNTSPLIHATHRTMPEFCY